MGPPGLTHVPFTWMKAGVPPQEKALDPGENLTSRASLGCAGEGAAEAKPLSWGPLLLGHT